MQAKLVGIGILMAAMVVLSACDQSSRQAGFYAQVKLPDGTVANLYAAYKDVSNTQTNPTFPNNGAADALFYIGKQQCESIYYPGDITIAQDFSTAVLNVPSTQWGALKVDLTATSTVGPSVPTPITCPSTDVKVDPGAPGVTTGIQQYVIGAGRTATGNYDWTVKKKGQPPYHVAGAITTSGIGAFVYDSVWNNPTAGSHLPVLHF